MKILVSFLFMFIGILLYREDSFLFPLCFFLSGVFASSYDRDRQFDKFLKKIKYVRSRN